MTDEPTRYEVLQESLLAAVLQWCNVNATTAGETVVCLLLVANAMQIVGGKTPEQITRTSKEVLDTLLGSDVFGTDTSNVLSLTN